MAKIRLYTTWYIDPEPARQSEIEECLRRNIDCAAIHSIYLLCEDELPEDLKHHPKLVAVPVLTRPTFDDIFAFSNHASTKAEDLNILSNSDIYHTDENVLLMKETVKRNVVLCLARWEVKEDQSAEIRITDTEPLCPFSQDTWVWRHETKVKANFHIGKLGCDNRLAYEWKAAGYQLLNPAKSIKTFHLHRSGVRRHKAEDTIPEPYCKVTIT